MRPQVLLIGLLLSSTVMAQQQEPTEPENNQISPQKVLRLLGADGRTASDAAKELLELADSNKDGYISRDEFLQHPRLKKTKIAGRIFDSLDRNRDGWIYAAEYLATWQSWVRSLPAGWDARPDSGTPAGGDRRPQRRRDQ